ncbi:MAG: dephospho-CoA kinase [Bifidobacteriaceae bacterium]|jgi:dephospho-CoA kinase|nr:dephospho-CoA kinase [Bifidobacteriaceae bacterium]
MRRIALTGGLAAGKSSVAARLRRLGVPVVDSDALARAVVAPGTPGLAAVAREFGPGVLRRREDGARDAVGGSAGSLGRASDAGRSGAAGRGGDAGAGPEWELDRAALAAIVFSDRAARLRLEAITHPLIRAAGDQIEASARAAGAAACVHDIPLFVETGARGDWDLVVTVSAPEELRLRRAVTGRGWSEQDARGRLAAQATDAEREAVADIVLDGAGTVAALEAQVDALVARYDLV